MMIEISLRVQGVLLVLELLCFGMAVGSAATDDTYPENKLLHCIFILGEMLIGFVMIVVTMTWVK